MKSNKRPERIKACPHHKIRKANGYALTEILLALLIVMLCASLLFSMSSTASRFHGVSVSQQLEF